MTLSLIAAMTLAECGDKSEGTEAAQGETSAGDGWMDGCPAEGAHAIISGSSPFGTFEGSAAWYSAHPYSCSLPGSVMLAIAEEAPVFLEEVAPPHTFGTWTPSGLLLYFGADGSSSPATVFVMKDGVLSEPAFGAVWVDTIGFLPSPDRDVPGDGEWPVMTGSLMVQDGNFSLQGTFVAPWCSELILFCD